MKLKMKKIKNPLHNIKNNTPLYVARNGPVLKGYTVGQGLRYGSYVRNKRYTRRANLGIVICLKKK